MARPETYAADPYASRIGGRGEMRERPDPVVWGHGAPSTPYGLSPEQIDFFDRNGYLTLPCRMPDAVGPLLEESRRLAVEMKGRQEYITEPESQEVRSVFSPHKLSALATRYARDARILDPVMQILGSQVYIHHSRVNVKPALSGRSFPWHSDFETWHVEDGLPRPRVLTAWIFLTDNTPFNGPLYLIPGSHRRYYSCPGVTPADHHLESLKKQEYGTPDRGVLQRMAEEGGGLAQAIGPAGTIVFHEGNTMHGSPDNVSPWPRTNIFFVFNSVENKPLAPFGGTKPRPEFLRALDFTPLQRVNGDGA